MTNLAKVATSLLGAFVLAGAALAAQSRPPEGPSADERVLLYAANKERAARNLRPLRWDASLARAARMHAQLMARNEAISHQFPGEQGLSERASRAGAHFRLIEENVGVASTALELHDLWMKSPPHRENLLNSQIDAAGIAVVAGPGGRLFAVQDFAKLSAVLTLNEQEKQVGSLLEAKGLRLTSPPADLRRTCALDKGIAPGEHPKYLFRFVTGDLESLPEELVAELGRSRYVAAAVGACVPADQGAFTQFRIAVELF
jgi:uncharacterized protein YkwD